MTIYFIRHKVTTQYFEAWAVSEKDAIEKHVAVMEKSLGFPLEGSLKSIYVSKLEVKEAGDPHYKSAAEVMAS